MFVLLHAECLVATSKYAISSAPYCLRNSHVAILLKLLDIGHFLCMVQHKRLLIAINEAEHYLLPT